MRNQNFKEKGYKVSELWECEWWNLFKTTTRGKEHLRESFFLQTSTERRETVGTNKKRHFFGYVQCDIEVPGNLKKKFANFPPIFKNTNVGREDIGLLMKDYAEKKWLLSQQRKTLISSDFFEIDTLLTPLLLFFLNLGLLRKKHYRFVE